jgi:O-antigen ligase
MYCVFCILILLYYYFLRESSKGSQLIAFLATAWLIMIVIMLSSKMFIFLLCLSGLYVGIYFSNYFRKIKLGTIGVLALLVVIPILLIKLPYTKDRIQYTKFNEYRGVIDNNNGLAVRGLLWKTSWRLIKHHPVFGYGHYQAQDTLRKQYFQTGFEEGYHANYNSHNQYLYTWLSYGIIGLFLFSFFLLRFLWFSFQKKIFLSVLLSSIVIIANITECMFETQKGIVFIMLFSCLLIYHAEQEGLPIIGKMKS